MKSNVITVEFRRGVLAVHLANLIGLVLESKQNPKRDKWILREVWGIVENYQIECKELCEQGLSWDSVNRFARLCIISGDRRLWLDGELWGHR